MPTAKYGHETNPQDYYMSREVEIEVPTFNPQGKQTGTKTEIVTLWDQELVVETGYPAGTAVITRRAKYVTQEWNGLEPEEVGYVPEISVAGYQQVQASPDTIAVYNGEFEYTLQAVYQQWVHAEIWNETFSYWERPTPIDKSSSVIYEPDTNRVLGVEYLADFGGGNYLKTVIDYNWFTGRVNKHTYKLYWPGASKRVYTQLQIYRPEHFEMDLSDFDGPYEVIEQAGLTNVIYYPDGVTEDLCEVDPYLGVIELADYIDVEMDGFLARFHFAQSSSSDHIEIYHGGTEITKSRNYINVGGNTYSWHFGASNAKFFLKERGPNRAVIEFISNFAVWTGGFLSGSVSVKGLYYVYPHMIVQEVEWITSGNISSDSNIYQSMLGMHTNTGFMNLYQEQSGVEISITGAGNLTTLYGSGRSSEGLNHTNYLLYDNSSILTHYRSSQGITICVNDNLTVPAGTHKWAIALHLDDQNRINDGGSFKDWNVGTTYSKDEIVRDSNGIRWISKVDSNLGNSPPASGSTSAFWQEYRMGMGYQYADYQLTNLEDIVNDLNLNPLSIDSFGFASDGGFQSEPRSSDGKSVLTHDLHRIEFKNVLKNFPFQYGSVSAPTSIGIAHLEFDDFAASSVLTDENGSNNATWKTRATNTPRNTNTAGDSVVLGYRNRSLDTQDGLGVVDMTFGVSSGHNADFIRKGSIMLVLTPKFDYNATEHQYIWICYQNATNYVQFYYHKDTFRYRMVVRWGDTIRILQSDVYGDSESLKVQSYFLLSWDYDLSFASLYLNGKVHEVANDGFGTPVAIDTTEHWIGANANRQTPSDMIIHLAKTFNKAVMSYGSIFAGNGSVDPVVAHKDIAVLLEGSENDTDTLVIPGTGQIDFFGSTTNGDGIDGTPNKSLSFPSAGSYLTIPASVMPNTNEGLSVQFWYKNDTPWTNNFITFISNSVQWSYFYIGVWSGISAIILIMGDGSSDQVYMSVESENLHLIVGDGNWHHLLFKVPAPVSNQGRFWLDGIERTNASTGTPIYFPLSGSMVIGGTIGQPNETVLGRIQNLIITNETDTPSNWTANGNPLHLPLVEQL